MDVMGLPPDPYKRQPVFKIVLLLRSAINQSVDSRSSRIQKWFIMFLKRLQADRL